MKKNSLFLGLIGIACSILMITGCIYDPPEPEIRPTDDMVIVTTAGGVSNAKVNEDGTVTAVLGFGKDEGVVIYLNSDKTESPENSKVSYEFSYKTQTWNDSSVKPKFYVRYGDSSSSFSNYDPSYKDKTEYEDASAASGEIKNSIILKNSADAIVFATNAYKWTEDSGGDSKDSVEITVKKISVVE